MIWVGKNEPRDTPTRSSHAFVFGIHTKRTIDYVVYSMNCNICEFKLKNDKRKGGDKEDGKGNGKERG